MSFWVFLMRRLSIRVAFISVAAVSLAAGGYALLASGDTAASAPIASTSTTTVVPAQINATVTVVATPRDIGARDVVHVSAMPWPGQRAMLSVCLRGAYNAATPKPCMYEADFTIPQRGQTVLLRNLTFTSGSIAPHSVNAAPEDIRHNRDVLVGPVAATVVRVKDGDTMTVRAETLPGYFVTDIRLGGIDTPESGGRADCPSEAALATRASTATRGLIEGRSVALSNVGFEKYGARMLGDIRTQAGVDAAQSLIGQQLARPYDGGTKQSWCAVPARR